MERAIRDVLTEPGFSEAQGSRSVNVRVCPVEKQQFIHLVCQRADHGQMYWWVHSPQSPLSQFNERSHLLLSSAFPVHSIESCCCCSHTICSEKVSCSMKSGEKFDQLNILSSVGEQRRAGENKTNRWKHKKYERVQYRGGHRWCHLLGIYPQPFLFSSLASLKISLQGINKGLPYPSSDFHSLLFLSFYMSN